MAHMTAHEEEHGLSIRQYVIIGLVLTVVTAIELWISYSGMPDALMITLLVGLSAFKFAVVVAFFMHLRFENGLMTKVFVGSFVLATLILFALLALFWGDLQGVPNMNTAAVQAGEGLIK
jgi:cytochrome c oxidase subunit IV